MKKIKIALVGQPNVGKSSLVNKLAGANIHVGNFTGTTVEILSAKLNYKGYELELIDLPGTYSLNEYSQEEKVAKQFLENEDLDVILNVVDSTNIERNLFLSAALLELNKKIVIALNMSDEAKKENVKIDVNMLSNLLGVNAVMVSANTGENLTKLLDNIIEAHNSPLKPSKRIYNDVMELEIQNLTNFLNTQQYDIFQNQNARHIAVSLLKGDDKLYELLHDKSIWNEILPKVQLAKEMILKQSDDKNIRTIFLNDTTSFARGVAMESCSIDHKVKLNKNQIADKIFLNKFFGIPIFLFFMWALFQLTFLIGGYPQGWIEELFEYIGQAAGQNIENQLISSFITNGVIGGVGAVLSFLPNILVLFFGIFLLEGTGYMARVAFLLDGFFHKFGLHGKSFIPLVSGFGCSIPAFMSTRVLKNNNDRLLTLFIINSMSCSARLPVYVLFVSAFFSADLAGNILFGIYIFGAMVGLVLAKILKKTVFKGNDEPFVMEMPKYRFPSLKLIIFSVWLKAKMFIKKAGTFILFTAIIVWAASNFPQNDLLKQKYEDKIQILESQKTAQNITVIESEIQNLEYQKESEIVEQSYLGRAGKFISPIFAPMDFDWKVSVAMISGLAAKEVIISTLGVLYSLGGEETEESVSLQNTLKNTISLPSAAAFILFIMFYNPCLAASVVFGKEAGKKRYVVYLFLMTSVMSYIFATIGYLVFSLFV